MHQGGEPKENLLARAGLITNEAGRVFEPSCGALYFPWLVPNSKEGQRVAREEFQSQRSVNDFTRYGWFIASTEAEFIGLRHLLDKDWRRALKAWSGSGVFQVHNRATLHRALYFSPESERPDAHLRECLRLYYHLSELVQQQSTYRIIQEELVQHLERDIIQAHQRGKDESASKSLKILAQTVGMNAVEHLQGKMFGQDLKDFRVRCARWQKELLSYQGMAHAAPRELLEHCEEDVKQHLLAEAARFSRKLVEGSKSRQAVEKITAELCGVLSQAFDKASDERGAKRWRGEAMRWEPSAVQGWLTPLNEDFEEEEAALVSFPKQEEEVEVEPQPWGSYGLGVQSTVVDRQLGQAREEWLESFFVAFTPVFPLRRYACYKNLDTDEVGYFLPVPLTVLDHVRQGFTVLLLSFILAVGFLFARDYSARAQKAAITEEARLEKKAKINGLVEQLKELAKAESRLDDLENPTKEEKERLKILRQKRLDLIKELEGLESKK